MGHYDEIRQADPAFREHRADETVADLGDAAGAVGFPGCRFPRIVFSRKACNSSSEQSGIARIAYRRTSIPKLKPR
jgi:hypothetical protein